QSIRLRWAIVWLDAERAARILAFEAVVAPENFARLEHSWGSVSLGKFVQRLDTAHGQEGFTIKALRHK
ncbi:MAG TPA: hypothetical protein VKA97_07010, partial [Pyrinomonadaceae bacterium]|nr:hypothetical protein [Pyrinomonadaceae bacterium]